MFDGDGNGGGNGHERVTMELQTLVDEVVLTYDRRNGTLQDRRPDVNLEVALDMCHARRALFESSCAWQAAAAVQQQPGRAAARGGAPRSHAKRERLTWAYAFRV